jgi:hypothetical protein
MTEKAEKGSALLFWSKVLFFVIVFLVVVFSVLSSLGGNSDVLKSAIEQYLSGALRGQGKVEKLHQMTFFPYMSVDAEGLSVVDPKNESRTVFNAERIQIAMGFWDMTFSSGKIKTFNLQKLRALPGVITQPGLMVNSAAIIDEGDQAYFRADGKIGISPFKISVTMETLGFSGNKKYRFGDTRDFKISLGSIEMSGTLESDNPENYVIKNFDIRRENLKITGNAELFAGSGGRMKLKGDFVLPAGTQAKPDILFEFLDKKPLKISGAVEISNYIDQDLADLKPYNDLWKELIATTQPPDSDKPLRWVADIALKAAGGEFPEKPLNLWSSGLMKAMVPQYGASGAEKMICAQADLSVRNDTVKAQNIFIDTIAFGVMGGGEYDLKNDKMNFSYMLVIKNAGPSEVGMAAKLTGPFGKYEIDPISPDPSAFKQKSCDDDLLRKTAQP